MRRFLSMSGILLVVGLLCGARPNLGTGREIHVALTGNDQAAGTQRAPWRTLGKAATEARAGGTVILHAGVYRETLEPAQAGTGENRRIVFKAAPGEEVILDGGTGRLTGWALESGTPGVNAIYRKAWADRIF